MSEKGTTVPKPAPLSQRKVATIRLATAQSFAGVLGRLLSVPVGILVATLLGPFQLGLLAILRLIQQYVGYAHMGLLTILPRNVPMAYGRGDHREARFITNVVFSGFAVASAAALAILWLLFLAGVTFSGVLTVTRLSLLTCILASNAALAFLRDYAKGEGQLMAIAQSDMVTAVVLPILTVPAVYWFAIEGALMAMCANNLTTLIYFVRLLGYPGFTFVAEPAKTFELLRLGVLVFANKMGDNLFWGLDLVVIGWLMTPREVGIYSLALTAITMVHPFLAGFNHTAYRRIMEETGEKGAQDRSIYKKYAGSAYFVSYLLLNSIMLGLAALGLLTVVRVALPEYAETSPILVILTFGYTIFGSMVFMRYYLDATGQLQRRLGLVFGAVMANVAFDYLAIKMGFGLQGVAWACTASFFLSAGFILVFCFGQIYGHWSAGVRFLLQLTVVSVLCVLFLIVCSRWVLFPAPAGAALGVVLLMAGLDLFVKAVAFMAWCAGAYILVFLSTNVHQELLSVVRYGWSALKSKLSPGGTYLSVPR